MNILKKKYSKNFCDFIKFFNRMVDIAKTEVEGFEHKIILSILKHSRPLLIEVEQI